MQLAHCSEKNDEFYRPVNVLSDVSKVFESMMYNQIGNFMKGRLSNLLTSTRKNHGFTWRACLKCEGILRLCTCNAYGIVKGLWYIKPYNIDCQIMGLQIPKGFSVTYKIGNIELVLGTV